MTIQHIAHQYVFIHGNKEGIGIFEKGQTAKFTRKMLCDMNDYKLY